MTPLEGRREAARKFREAMTGRKFVFDASQLKSAVQLHIREWELMSDILGKSWGPSELKSEEFQR